MIEKSGRFGEGLSNQIYMLCLLVKAQVSGSERRVLIGIIQWFQEEFPKNLKEMIFFVYFQYLMSSFFFKNNAVDSPS